jgi:hypothetical protein
VADSVPAAFQKLNLEAFEKGFEYGTNLIAERGENAVLEESGLEVD